MADRLEEIKQRHSTLSGNAKTLYLDMDWLIREVERHREILSVISVYAQQLMPPVRDGESIEDWLGRQSTESGDFEKPELRVVTEEGEP